MKKTLHISLFVLFLAVSTILIAYIYYLRSQQNITAVKINIIRETEKGFLEQRKYQARVKKEKQF